MKKLLMAFAIVCSVSVLRAEADYYATVCAWVPGQIPMSSSSQINGLRVTLFYGDCLRLNGLDLAILGANRVREGLKGVSVASVFERANTAAGLQLGFVNMVENEFAGVQFGMWDHAGHGYGTQWSVVNTAGYFGGLQLGLINCADQYDGLQLGLFNWADDLDGLQLGLINVVADQTLCVLPFLNIGW